MEASQSIQLKTEQKLVISQRLQQQLAILHMTLQEVAALANEQLQSNPMLEVAEGAEAADSPFSDLSLDALEGTLARSESFDDGALPVSSGATFYRAGQSGDAPADFLRYTYKPESLEDYLAFQLADYPLSEAQKQICRHLIAMLDEHGFFREPLADAAQLLGTDEFELTQMLYVIQSLDPPGIGARDLQECLILQLAAGDCCPRTGSAPLRSFWAWIRRRPRPAAMRFARFRPFLPAGFIPARTAPMWCPTRLLSARGRNCLCR